MAALCLTINIGFLQYGMGITCWNIISLPYAIHHDWLSTKTATEITEVNRMIQVYWVIGCALGSLCVGNFAKFGRWRMIIIANILNIVGCIITMVTDENQISLCVGRFISGLATGVLTVICPKYMSETAPIKIKGPVGGCSALMLVTGWLFSFIMGYAFSKECNEDRMKENIDAICSYQVWV